MGKALAQLKTISREDYAKVKGLGRHREAAAERLLQDTLTNTA
jgi:hypothetical protein